MHNIKAIRNNLEFFEKKFKERFENVNLKKLLSLDKENRELIQKKEKLEQEKKIISKSYGKIQLRFFKKRRKKAPFLPQFCPSFGPIFLRKRHFCAS